MENELEYKQAYLTLFNKVSDCIALLREAQAAAEEACIAEKEA